MRKTRSHLLAGEGSGVLTFANPVYQAAATDESDNSLKGLTTQAYLDLMIIGANVAIAEEAPKDAAIIVAVSGAVMHHNQTKQPSPGPVQPFMKMYQDDVLTLEVESQVKLLYPKGGRKETWQGPAVLVLGEKESVVQGQDVPQPQIENLPKIARSVRETNLPLIVFVKRPRVL